MFRKRAQKNLLVGGDSDLALIDANAAAIVTARLDHLRGAVGYTPEQLARERADVERLAAGYRAAWLADLLSRGVRHG